MRRYQCCHACGTCLRSWRVGEARMLGQPLLRQVYTVGTPPSGISCYRRWKKPSPECTDRTAVPWCRFVLLRPYCTASYREGIFSPKIQLFPAGMAALVYTKVRGQAWWPGLQPHNAPVPHARPTFHMPSPQLHAQSRRYREEVSCENASPQRYHRVCPPQHARRGAGAGVRQRAAVAAGSAWVRGRRRPPAAIRPDTARARGHPRFPAIVNASAMNISTMSGALAFGLVCLAGLAFFRGALQPRRPAAPTATGAHRKLHQKGGFR